MSSNKKVIILTSQFKKFISYSKSGKRQALSGKCFSQGTIEQYQCVLKLLKEFEKDLNMEFRILVLTKNNQKLIYSEKLYWKRFFKNFTQWLYIKKYFVPNFFDCI